MTEPTVIEQADDAEFTPVVREPEQTASLTLFHTDDPVQIVEHATKVANALSGVLESRQLYKMISGKKHVLVEGWTLLGSMNGVYPVLEACEPVELDGVKGFKATVAAQTMSGQVIGRASAYCMRDENRWKSADKYAVASMAQTRATSKCLRAPLGFIMQLAGYEATPEAEMPTEQPSQAARKPPAAPKADETQGQPNESGTAGATTTTREPRKATERQITLLHVLLGKCYDRELFQEPAYRAQLKKDYGVESSKQLSSRDCSQLIDRLSLVLGEPTSPA